MNVAYTDAAHNPAGAPASAANASDAATWVATMPQSVPIRRNSAGAASIAYSEGGNLVLASPDGAHQLALTTDGTDPDPYYGIAQAADGTTVAARLQTFDKRRPVLYKFAAADGRIAASNVMPSSALLDGVVSPVGLDIDAAGKTVAFGYSACELSG